MAMEVGAEDTALAEENQGQECEPFKLIPEGFVVDDSLPSISLEDFTEENEIWLVDVPVAVDPQKLIGQQLDFRQETSFIIDEQANEKCVTLPSDGPCSAICLLSSRHDNSKKIVSLNPSGKISISINYDVPVFGAMIPDSTSVPLPVGLKIRHPFLGTGLKNPLVAMDDECINTEMHLIQSERKQMANNHMATVMSALKEDPGERLNLLSLKKEAISPKKSRKRKLESLDEDGNGETPEIFGDTSVHLSKKRKKDKIEESNSQESAISSEANENLVEDAFSVKKSKKHKKRESEITETELYTPAIIEAVHDLMSSPSVDVHKKKIKKEKEHQGSGEGVVDISIMGSPEKAKKKKKRDSEILSEALQGNESTINYLIGDASAHNSRGLNAKKEHHEEINDTMLTATYAEESDEVKGIGFSLPKMKKEKSKRRKTLESIGIETVDIGADGIDLGVTRKIKESAEENVHGVEIEVLHEEGYHVKKKRKKEKIRELEVFSSESDLQISRVEVCAIPDTPETTPRMKVKEEHRLKGVADVSFVESSVPFEFCEETPKKAKKKKKRDSELGFGSGKSDVVSDEVLVEGKSSQVSGKKMKKEMKREMDGSILNISNEEEGDARLKKSKKKHSMNKAGVDDLYVDSQDPCMITGRKEMEGVTTLEEEVDILMEVGEHLKKKKKDKRRESEVESSDLDKILKKEVDIILETPERTPKKKKKKIKEELDSNTSLERTVEPLLAEAQLSLEGFAESTKKTKKKKKRESEYGNGADLSAMSEDVVLEEVSGQVSEVVGKLKKERWFIDREPCSVELSPGKSKKMKKVHGEKVLDAYLEGESSGSNNNFYSESKKLKKRHTMDVADTSALTAERSRISSLSEVKMEGKSHHKKRQSLMTPGSGIQLLSPKKEKKMKREHIE